MKKLIFIFTLLVSWNSLAGEQAELAKKLSNPVANLISVPVDFILEEGIGPTGDGEATIIKASPVLPFTLNDDWNLISRTVISYVDQDDIPGKGMGESGFSDIAESTHDLEADETGTVAIFHIGQMFKLGSQIMQGRIGVRSWLDETEFDPESTTNIARSTS